MVQLSILNIFGKYYLLCHNQYHYKTITIVTHGNRNIICLQKCTLNIELAWLCVIPNYTRKIIHLFNLVHTFLIYSISCLCHWIPIWNLFSKYFPKTSRRDLDSLRQHSLWDSFNVEVFGLSNWIPSDLEFTSCRPLWVIYKWRPDNLDFFYPPLSHKMAISLTSLYLVSQNY